MFNPSGPDSANLIVIGAALREVFPQEILEDLEPLLRRADRMGTTTTQLEVALHRSHFNAALTVAMLQHEADKTSRTVDAVVREALTAVYNYYGLPKLIVDRLMDDAKAMGMSEREYVQHVLTSRYETILKQGPGFEKRRK